MARLLSETIFESWADYPKTRARHIIRWHVHGASVSTAPVVILCSVSSGVADGASVTWLRVELLRLPARGPAPAGRRSTLPRHHGMCLPGCVNCGPPQT